ncbi:uncharacterized protein TNCV_3811561 [Trichonephila clavipes]|nr:uncharacterized protein TNCV_3811561 [Trichonephila clavipes]
MDVCKCIVPSRHGCTLNSRRAASALVSKGRIEAFTTVSPHTNTIVITAEIESGFASLKTTWFHSTVVQFPRSPNGLSCSSYFPALHHSKWKRQWVGVKRSTRNRRSDPKCPSARPLRMIQEDTGAPNEGATCAWMAAEETVGCMRAFLTMWRPSRRLVCRGRPEPSLRAH